MDTNDTTPSTMSTDSSQSARWRIMEGQGGSTKKYIRTFESDMAAVKSGNIPDLAPLTEPISSPVRPAPVVATPVPPPPPISVPVPPQPIVVPMPTTQAPPPISNPHPTPIPSSNIGHVLNAPLSISIEKIEAVPAPAAVSTPTMVPEPPKEQEKLPEQPIKSAPLETYASDFSDRMKESNASLVTVLASEQDAATTIPEPVQKSSRVSVLYISMSVVLLVVGSVGAYIAYTKYATAIIPVILAPTVSSPIFVDDREQISGVGTVLSQAIEQATTHPLASGAVLLLYTANATTTDSSVFSSLQLPAPNILLRNIHAADSIAGIVNAGGNRSPFFILSALSYSATFSGMLSWESSMANDLQTLFPPYPKLAPVATISSATTTPITLATSSPTISKNSKQKSVLSATTTVATTTSTTPKIISTVIPGFRDEVIDNHDARVYRDASGKSVVLYGYWNQTTLIIARDPASFTEILNRLATSHTQQ